MAKRSSKYWFRVSALPMAEIRVYLFRGGFGHKFASAGLQAQVYVREAFDGSAIVDLRSEYAKAGARRSIALLCRRIARQAPQFTPVTTSPAWRFLDDACGFATEPYGIPSGILDFESGHPAYSAHTSK